MAKIKKTASTSAEIHAEIEMLKEKLIKVIDKELAQKKKLQGVVKKALLKAKSSVSAARDKLAAIRDKNKAKATAATKKQLDAARAKKKALDDALQDIKNKALEIKESVTSISEMQKNVLAAAKEDAKRILTGNKKSAAKKKKVTATKKAAIKKKPVAKKSVAKPKAAKKAPIAKV